MAYLSGETDRHVVINKGHMTSSSFKEEYHKLLATGAHERGPMLLHFRIATAGQVSGPNTHPFKVKGGAVIHNGYLWNGGRNDVMSDTRKWAAMLHNRLTADVVAKNKFDLNLAAGSNRLAFLYDGGEYVIINEDDGVWDEGVWFSHRGYKPYKRK